MRSGTRIALVLAACVVAACAGDLENPERFASLAGGDGGGGVPDASPPLDTGVAPPVLDAGGGGGEPACVTDTLASVCGTTACHGPGAPQVDLVSPGVRARVVDQPASAAGLCAGRTYVASDGSGSLLLDKLVDPPPCGSKMPLVGAITAVQSQCLADWVGALAGGM